MVYPIAQLAAELQLKSMYLNWIQKGISLDFSGGAQYLNATNEHLSPKQTSIIH